MTPMQEYAISHPKARASGDAAPFARDDPPWRLILTVNK
jgi:hypothetical protein